MAKYGKGLNIEFVEAVMAGKFKEPFSIEDFRKYSGKRGSKPSEKYINVLLPNGSSEVHSLIYKKLFISLGSGLYKLSDLAK